VLNAEAHLTQQERAVFDAAVQRACDELGLGELSLDVAKREQVAQSILEFVYSGEENIDVLHRRAVIRFRNTFSESA
jgi:hypothetical protein